MAGVVLWLVAMAPGCAGPERTVRTESTAGGSAAPDRRPQDRDRDGIVDERDQCPAVAEDCDGFQDQDGCPEFDNDGDGIHDGCDRCPMDPETYNGVDDEDGCPEAARIVIERSDIRIIPHVHFENGSVRVERSSMEVIEAVAAVLREHPDIERILVRGNASLGETDPVGLSLRRARAVRDLIVSRNVAPDRIEVSGEGVTRPLADNRTEQGRAMNRRIDFEVVRTADTQQASPRPVIIPPHDGPPRCPGRDTVPEPLPPPPGGCPQRS